MGRTEDADAGAGPVIVTGGTGFLGRAVVRQLRDRGFTVRALARTPGDADVCADIRDEAALGRAFAGAAAVVGLEGGAWASSRQAERTTRAETERAHRKPVMVAPDDEKPGTPARFTLPPGLLYPLPP